MHLFLGHDHESLKKLGLHGLVEIEEEAMQALGLRLQSLRDIRNPAHIEEDMELLAKGILDPASFRNGYLYFEHRVQFIVHDADGALRAVRRSHNLRTDAGGDFWAAQLCGSAQTATAQFMALSDDATAPAPTDTTLAGEITTNGLARAQGTYAHTPVTGGSNATVTSSLIVSHTFTATGVQSAQKCAIFTAITAGIMVLVSPFTEVTLQISDTGILSYGLSG